MPSRTRLEFTARTSLASRSGASDRMWPTIRLHTVRTRRSQAAGTITSSSVRLLRMDMCAHSHTRAPQGLYPCSLPPHTLPQPLTVVSRRSPKLRTPAHSGRPPSLILALIHPLSPSFAVLRPPSPSLALLRLPLDPHTTDNSIHHASYECTDTGAFYIGRSWSQRGNVVRYNLFDTVRPTEKLAQASCSQNAFYLDVSQPNTTSNTCDGDISIRLPFILHHPSFIHSH